MASKKREESKKFREFEFKGEVFGYSGRIYTENQRTAGKLTITPISLCLNDVITIKGCSFMETKDNMWISGPSYKVGDEYKDYLYFDKDLNPDLDKLAEVISKELG